ncbi:hypothetical protein Vretimale_16717 [Volvox reticuliferus]|uniref:Uncharacterized protein n=1 Tax=Volvox reticuliferus TaxID=1737510 RepID=A0A8J4GRP0_9CHLO|nr:hypothetical protein Vretifemale_8534 [Volvox reticuliferus]GIM13651.1 hypothetical protein Vretimale_16717 [Volvox reticuliferus]
MLVRNGGMRTAKDATVVGGSGYFKGSCRIAMLCNVDGADEADKTIGNVLNAGHNTNLHMICLFVKFSSVLDTFWALGFRHRHTPADSSIHAKHIFSIQHTNSMWRLAVRKL